jgi:hypothetical protein
LASWPRICRICCRVCLDASIARDESTVDGSCRTDRELPD